MKDNLLNYMEYATDFESVVSTISPLRQYWGDVDFVHFFQNHLGSFGTFRTASGHNSGHIRSLLFLSLCLAGGSIQAQDVYWNIGAGNDTGQVDKIKYAAWIASERTGMRVEYAGETTLPCVPGAITYRTLSAQEWMANGLPLLAPDAFAGSCAGGGYIVALNSGNRPSHSLITHEAMHTLGDWSHNPDTGSLMYGKVTSSFSVGEVRQPTIATIDILNVLATPNWPLYDEPEFCFAELLPNWDIYHPDIQGKRGLLIYTGIKDGLHTWKKGSVTPNPDSQGCDGSYVDEFGDIHLDDVRSQDLHVSAWLYNTGGGTWALGAASNL